MYHRSSIRDYTYKDKLTCSNHVFRAETSLCVKQPRTFCSTCMCQAVYFI